MPALFEALIPTYNPHRPNVFDPIMDRIHLSRSQHVAQRTD